MGRFVWFCWVLVLVLIVLCICQSILFCVLCFAKLVLWLGFDCCVVYGSLVFLWGSVVSEFPLGFEFAGLFVVWWFGWV